MKHEELMLLPQKSRISSSHNGGMTHVIRIHEDISEPSNWSDELDLINSCSEQDTVVLDVCSPGGYLDTAMLFHRSLNSCAAHTIAIIGPECASAASVISLSCREWILDDTSSLMIHTSSYSLGGKDTDILEHANFSRNQLKRLYEKVYSGFLSPEDLSDVIKGTPFYFDAENIADRLDALQEYRASLPCPCGSPECGQNNGEEMEEDDFPEFNLEELVEKAVQAGVTKALAARDAKERKTLKLELAEEKKGSLHLRVFPNWHLAKYDIEGHREAGELDGSKITKFNVKQSKATLENGDYVIWMVSNPKDTDKFQGLRPVTAFLHDGVDEVSREYISTRILSK